MINIRTPQEIEILRQNNRLVAHVLLTEYDGSRISQDRAGQVLSALQRRLSTTSAEEYRPQLSRAS